MIWFVCQWHCEGVMLVQWMLLPHSSWWYIDYWTVEIGLLTWLNLMVYWWCNITDVGGGDDVVGGVGDGTLH